MVGKEIYPNDILANSAKLANGQKIAQVKQFNNQYVPKTNQKPAVKNQEPKSPVKTENQTTK